MRYKVTLVIDTDNGNPRKWNWSELLGEDVIQWEADRLEEEKI